MSRAGRPPASHRRATRSSPVPSPRPRSPRGEVGGALGSGDPASGMDELSDADYAGMGAGHSTPTTAPGGTTVERVTQHALGGTLGRNGDGMVGSSLGGTMSGPLGAVG